MCIDEESFIVLVWKMMKNVEISTILLDAETKIWYNIKYKGTHDKRVR